MNLIEQIEQIKEFFVNFSIDINTDDVPALVDHLNLLLAGNALSEASQAEISELVEAVPEDSGGNWRTTRAGLAVTLVMIDADYLIQR